MWENLFALTWETCHHFEFLWPASVALRVCVCVARCLCQQDFTVARAIAEEHTHTERHREREPMEKQPPFTNKLWWCATPNMSQSHKHVRLLNHSQTSAQTLTLTSKAEASDLLPNDTQVHKGKRSLYKESLAFASSTTFNVQYNACIKMKLKLISEHVRSSTELREERV